MVADGIALGGEPHGDQLGLESVLDSDGGRLVLSLFEEGVEKAEGAVDNVSPTLSLVQRDQAGLLVEGGEDDGGVGVHCGFGKGGGLLAVGGAKSRWRYADRLGADPLRRVGAFYAIPELRLALSAIANPRRIGCPKPYHACLAPKCR